MQDVFSPHSAPQVRWNHRKSTYDAEKLRALFLPYGDILHISARKKRALVVFRTPESASEAMAHEVRSSTTDFFTNILDLESLFLIFFFLAFLYLYPYLFLFLLLYSIVFLFTYLYLT
jgi:hypothetical protein